MKIYKKYRDYMKKEEMKKDKKEHMKVEKKGQKKEIEHKMAMKAKMAK